MKPTDSYLKKKLLKVLYFIINCFLGNLLFLHYLLKVEKPAPVHIQIPKTRFPSLDDHDYN